MSTILTYAGIFLVGMAIGIGIIAVALQSLSFMPFK